MSDHIQDGRSQCKHPESELEPDMLFPTMRFVRPAKAQISLRLRRV